MDEQSVLLRGTGAPGWRILNIDPAERLARVTVGVGVAIIGILVLITTGSLLATVLAVLLLLAGLDLLLTGALGHCPVYARLGHTPRSQRRTFDRDPPAQTSFVRPREAIGGGRPRCSDKEANPVPQAGSTSAGSDLGEQAVSRQSTG